VKKKIRVKDKVSSTEIISPIELNKKSLASRRFLGAFMVDKKLIKE
jgi:hypothetical protein